MSVLYLFMENQSALQVPPACFLWARVSVCVSVCVCVVGGKTLYFTDVKLEFLPLLPPQPLLSRLFVPALITALRAAKKTPLAFMRLMKVSADGSGAALPPCVCTHGSVRLQALTD